LVGAHTTAPATALAWTAIGGLSGGVLGARRFTDRHPAVVALERIPVPSLAIARDGIILFANTAFAEMVGYEGQDR
jgi:PAS domain-containing protein